MWIALEANIDTSTTQDHHAYYTSNHKLAIEIGRWSTIHMYRGNKSCDSCSHDGNEKEAYFVLECPYMTPVKISFDQYLIMLYLGVSSLFFQLNRQVDISFYLIEANALCHSRELGSLTQYLCTFKPINLLASHILKSIFISLISLKEGKVVGRGYRRGRHYKIRGAYHCVLRILEYINIKIPWTNI